MKPLSFRRIGHGLFLIVLFLSCQKRQEKTPTGALPAEIQSARMFFNNTILSSTAPSSFSNYRSRLPKSARWDLAQTTLLSGQPVVTVPIQFAGNVYVTSDLAPGSAFDLGGLTRLVISRDSANVFHYGLFTYIPDSTAIRTQSYISGILLSEDWQGNSISSPQRFAHRKSTAAVAADNKQVDIVQTIQVCNEIDGYNYAPDDPAGGLTSWSETSCNTYALPSQTTGPTIGPGSLPGLLGPKPIPILTVEIAPPTNPISDIASYFKCFTNGSAPDHTYSIQVCVDQPDPGTRDPWGLTAGGLAGSLNVGNVVNSGHTFLIFTENNQGNITSRNVGFYPSGIVYPTNNGAYSQGVLGNDESHIYNISLTLNVTSNQFFNILNYVSLGNNTGYYYNLNTNNCATFALNALSAGGISLPSTQGSWPGGSGNDPGDLGEDIRNLTLSSSMARNTVENPHPNIGSCN
jgi:hypothetical protein